MNDNTIMLGIIAILQGLYLLGQKNQRDDFKELRATLEKWVEILIKIKAEHEEKHGKKHECG